MSSIICLFPVRCLGLEDTFNCIKSFTIIYDFENAKATLNILSFEQSVFVSKAKIMYKVADGLVLQYICDLFTRSSEVAHGTSLRSITNQNFAIPKLKLTLYKESISHSSPVFWNNIIQNDKKGTSRQRSGKGAIRKRFPLQTPRWEKTKLTIRYLYHENIS